MSLRVRARGVPGGLPSAALCASAYDGDVVVGLDKACPEGTARSVPCYSWKDGGLVHVGWVCTSLYKGGN